MKCRYCGEEKQEQDMHTKNQCVNCWRVQRSKYRREYRKTPKYKQYWSDYLAKRRRGPNGDKIREKERAAQRAARTRYKEYRKAAKKRDYEFSISFAYFENLFNSPCFWCGDPDSHGVDRVDNSVGYTESNCVPCCKSCNYMKHAKQPGEWVKHMAKIFRNLNLSLDDTENLPADFEFRDK